MSKQHIDDIFRAADYLDLEEVRYALGLDFEYVQYERTTVKQSGGRVVVTTERIEPAEAEREMQERIDEHDRLIERLRDYAASNR